MKDGTDGINLAFKLKVVDLDENADGEPESSCIIEHVDTAPEEAGAKRYTKLGAREQIMLDLLRMMAPSGTCDENDLFEGYKGKVPRNADGRDQRLGHARQALTNLISKKLAYKHGEERVSLTSLVTSGGEADWLS